MLFSPSPPSQDDGVARRIAKRFSISSGAVGLKTLSPNTSTPITASRRASISSVSSSSSGRTTTGISLPTTNTSFASSSKFHLFDRAPHSMSASSSVSWRYDAHTSGSPSVRSFDSGSNAVAPTVDVVPWIIHDHRAQHNDAASIKSKSSETSSEKKNAVRMVGRGGQGSRPRQPKRQESISTVASEHLQAFRLQSTSPPAPPTEAARMVGRGGSGSKPRSVTDKSASHSPTTSLHSVPSHERQQSMSSISPVRVSGRGGAGVFAKMKQPTTSPGSPPLIPISETQPQTIPTPLLTPSPPKVVRMGGRGGAGSKPRHVKPPKPKDETSSSVSKWLGKGKSKRRQPPTTSPSNPIARIPSIGSETSSLHFSSSSLGTLPPAAPSLHSHYTFPTNDSSSVSATLEDSYPPTPSISYSDTPASSIYHDTPDAEHPRRNISKLARTLGERLPRDLGFMSIRPPTLTPYTGPAVRGTLSPTYNDRVLQLEQRSPIHHAYPAPPPPDSLYKGEGVSETDTESVLSAPYTDDLFDTTSHRDSVATLTSPIVFSERHSIVPPVEPPSDKDSDDDSILAPKVTRRMQHTVHIYSSDDDVAPDPTSLVSQKDSSIVDASWSGHWNGDMRDVIQSLRELR